MGKHALSRRGRKRERRSGTSTYFCDELLREGKRGMPHERIGSAAAEAWGRDALGTYIDDR